MEKIDPSGSGAFLNPALYANAAKPREKSPVRDTKKPKFSRFLGEILGKEAGEEALAAAEFSGEALEGLLDDVHSSGDALKQRPFPEEIRVYKKAVRNFLHYVVENGFDVRESQGIKKKVTRPGGAVWQENVYHQVQVVDQKLEQLAAGILGGQLTQIELLAKVDEITGLLVNLVE